MSLVAPLSHLPSQCGARVCRVEGAVGCPRPPAHLCTPSLAGQYRSVRQKAARSRGALQQRHEVLKAETPGGGCRGHCPGLWVDREEGMAGDRQGRGGGGWASPKSPSWPPRPSPCGPRSSSPLPPDSVISFWQMPPTFRGDICWLAWTRWPEIWTGRRRLSRESYGRRWSRAGLCRTALNGPRTLRYHQAGLILLGPLVLDKDHLPHVTRSPE